jgi:ribA/ribD-fused uncharacterized protein
MAIIEFRGEYRWLSNFAEAEVEWEGRKYPTTEHAYQAAKTTIVEEIEHVRQASTPGRARRRGQKVTMRNDWDEVKVGVMKNLLEQKFQITEYRDLLLATGGHHLMEGNSWGDSFWGVSLDTGMGTNHLGRILMDIRDQLYKEKVLEELKSNKLFE